MSVTRLDVARASVLLNDFDFRGLFNELGWSNPTAPRAETFAVGDAAFTRRAIAELSGIVVYEVQAADPAAFDGGIPDKATQAKVSKEVEKATLEHVLVFVDPPRTKSVWVWTKRDGGKRALRDHHYLKGQPGDLFLSKIAALVVDLSELDEEGRLPLVAAAKKVRDALDVERVIKRFYTDYEALRVRFTALIGGIPEDADRRWYASVLLNRLMFVYFLQRKGYLDGGDRDYLKSKLAASGASGRDLFYSEFLQALFFEAFAKPKEHRKAEARALTGEIRYLNGGLFLEHRLEAEHAITVPDAAFEELLGLFGKYSWNLNDVPGEDDNDINPDVLGYIFEKYINQKEFGAYYTRPEITEYLCERTIHRLILDRVNVGEGDGVMKNPNHATVADLLVRLDVRTAHALLDDVLPSLTILDPAVGSGAFLVAALKTLVNVYTAVLGWVEFYDGAWADRWLKARGTTRARKAYAVRKAIITDNLYGVDIMEEATEIAKLRLFMTLVASTASVEELEPLPNIDFNILAGNSLIGLLRVDDGKFDAGRAKGKRQDVSLFGSTTEYKNILADREQKLRTLRDTGTYMEDLGELNAAVREIDDAAGAILDGLLLEDFSTLGVRYEAATWDDAKGALGKPVRRALAPADIGALEPFHWGFEFDDILNRRGGFDAIITNPPWEILKPQAKEFFEDHSDLVTKNKMTVKEFETEQARLVADPKIRAAFLAYLSKFPHQSAYYRASPDYPHQSALVNGKRTGTDVNLYKLFTERCYGLLRPGGLCGIVIPSGIYTDLGTKGLRELLFAGTEVTGLFGFENRKEIFEGVHRSFKFVLLSFRKGGATVAFPATFMRLDVRDLERFPHSLGMTVRVEDVKRMSPDALSIMEFVDARDESIAAKMAAFPALGDEVAGVWRLRLGNEVHMSNDRRLFLTAPAAGALPLYEGKMTWQFDHRLSGPKYWIDETIGRKSVLGRTPDAGGKIGYQSYRLAHRSVASNTNERSLIVSVLPPNVFFGHSLNASRPGLAGADLLFAAGVLNSYVVDFALRKATTTNLTMNFVYQLRVPRLTAADPRFAPIAERAARLVCTTPEYADLWQDALREIAGEPAVPASAPTTALTPATQEPVATMAGTFAFANEIGQASFPVEEDPVTVPAATPAEDGRHAWTPASGATAPAERARLRAELDALVAHLYDLTEEEFTHVLAGFPLVPSAVRTAAINAYRDVLRGVLPTTAPVRGKDRA